MVAGARCDRHRSMGSFKLAALLLCLACAAAPVIQAHHGTGFAGFTDMPGLRRLAQAMANGTDGGNATMTMGVNTATESGWMLGRASWYGTPQPFVSAFAPSRGGGEAAFGILEWGGCGYTNSDGGKGQVPLPKEAVGAYSDKNEDSAGSCGRCYEVRCKEGYVLGWEDKPVPYEGNFYYFPQHASAPDTQGRSFPGNPAEKEGLVYVKCWDPKKSVRVRIIDICPCYYCPETGPRAGECYYQESCCNKAYKHPKAGQNEFDLSFWAYEQLAHPMYPEMMLEYRPVDCGSGEALPRQPPSISKTLYGNGFPGPGWSWFVQKEVREPQDFQVTASGEGASGNAAACATVDMGEGGMTWWCRMCDELPQGSGPFDNAKTISLKIKSKTNPGEVPPVQLTLYQLSGAGGKNSSSKHCDTKVSLKDRSPSGSSGDYKSYDIPISDFKCKEDVRANKLDVLLTGGSGNYKFCMDDVKVA